MLDWLLKNPQVIIFIVFIVIALIGRIAQAHKELQAKRKQEMRSGKQQPAAQPSMRGSSATDADEAERTRRIQEEVRRKILARMERPQAPASMPRPVASPVSRTSQQADTMPPPLPPAKKPQPAPLPDDDESTTAYRSAMQQLAEMQARAAASGANIDKAFALQAADSTEVSPASGDLFDSLRNTSELRRAIILREILDKPVSLRG